MSKISILVVGFVLIILVRSYYIHKDPFQSDIVSYARFSYFSLESFGTDHYANGL